MRYSTRGGRVHRVTAELDSRGEIDAHAALCLRHAIGAAHGGPVATILVDLRDLTAIDPIGVALFRAHDGDCRSHGHTLGLLISGDARHRHIADAFERGGLAATLQIHRPAARAGHRVSPQAHRARFERAPRTPGAHRPPGLPSPPAPGARHMSVAVGRAAPRRAAGRSAGRPRGILG